MSDKAKVTVEITDRTTTIHDKEGVVEKHLKGVLKGFGSGLQDYILRGGKKMDFAVTVNTGSYPEGHAKEGKWAIQVMVDAFDTQEDANTVADRLAVQIKQLLNPPLASMPKPIGITKQ